MLTEEGKESARECLSRSGFAKSIDGLPTMERSLNLDRSHQTDQEFARTNSVEEIATLDVGSSAQEKLVDVPPESLDRVWFKIFQVL